MALFTIHYENSTPTNITYKIGNRSKTESVDELLCDFINSFDASHLYFRPEDDDKRYKVIYPEATSAISIEKNYDMHNGTFGNPFDIYVNIGLPMPSSLYGLADKFQKEIFKNDVYYFLNGHRLAFNQTVEMNIHPFKKMCNNEFSHVNEILRFDPAIFSIYRHFLTLKEALATALSDNVISLGHPINKWQALYIQSDDFIYRQLRDLMDYYRLENNCTDNTFNLIWQDFGLRSDLESFCLEYSSAKDPLSFTFSRASKYQLTKADLFRAGFKKNQKQISSDYAKKLLSDIDRAYAGSAKKERMSQKEMHNVINSSNKILIDAFYSPEKHGRPKAVSLKNNTISVDYEDFASGKPTSISYPYAYTLDNIFQSVFGYEYNKKFISPACAMYMAFDGDTDNNPFMYPILHSDFDMYEYINVMPFHSFSYMVKDLEKIMNIDYRNFTFDIETNSLTKVLVCLFDDAQKDNSKIKRCMECGNYFVALNGYDKYCDAALPKEIKGRNDYDYKNACSYIAKQKQTAARIPEIKKLQSFRRNEQNYFLREVDFFNLDIPVYHDRYYVEKSTILATPATELDSVTLKLFSALRCGILLCTYDRLKKEITQGLLKPDSNSDFLLKYGKSLLNHDFKESNLPTINNTYCRYHNRTNLFPYRFDWADEINAIVSKSYRNDSVKIKERMDLMRYMLQNYVSWAKSNNILSHNVPDVAADSNTLESIHFLAKLLPEEWSAMGDEPIIVRERKGR